MVQVEIVDGRLRVEILGWHKLWAFKSRIVVPLEKVVAVRAPKVDERLRGTLRAPGTYVPGFITAGSYYHLKTRQWLFWDVCKLPKAVVIELRDEKYARLVVEVADPRATIETLRAQIR